MVDLLPAFGTEWLHASRPIADVLVLAAWQGAMIAAIAAIALAFLRHARPIWRYATAVTALVLLTVLPVLTWTLTSAPPAGAQAPGLPAAAPVAPAPPAVQVPEFVVPPAVSPPTAPPAPISQASGPTLAETLWSGWGQLVDTAVPGPVADAAASMQAWGEQTAPWWVAVWLVGVAFSLIKVAGGLWWIRSVRRSATPLPASLRPLVVAAAHQAGTRTTISVKQSRRVDVPLVSGWLSPVVLLPSRLIEDAPEEEIEALLVHELTHIRRHDVPVGWLQAVTEALLFFHPAAWWVSRQVRREREHGTDDRVTSVGVSPVTYAQALTRVAESVLDARPVPHGTLAPAASDGELLHRIRRMVTDTPEPLRRGSLFFATVALLAVPVLFAACSSAEKAAEAPGKVSAPAPPSAPEAPSTSSNMVITRSHDGDTTRVKTFRLETNDGESVSVQRVRIQGDSVWLNDSLVVDSTWSAAFDSSFTYRLDFGDFLTDVDTAAFNASMRDLRFGLDRLPETLQDLNRDSTRAMFGFHAWAMDSLRVSVDSLVGLRLAPDSLVAKIERGLRSRDSLHILLPRLDDSFRKGLRPNMYRFEMETEDRLRILPDSARTPEAMMREAERLRREAERMEEQAREMEEQSRRQREDAVEEMRKQREEMERRRQEMMEQRRDSLQSF